MISLRIWQKHVSEGSGAYLPLGVMRTVMHRSCGGQRSALEAWERLTPTASNAYFPAKWWSYVFEAYFWTKTDPHMFFKSRGGYAINNWSFGLHWRLSRQSFDNVVYMCDYSWEYHSPHKDWKSNGYPQDIMKGSIRSSPRRVFNKYGL